MSHHLPPELQSVQDPHATSAWAAVSLPRSPPHPAALLAQALGEVMAAKGRAGESHGAAASLRTPTVSVVTLGTIPTEEVARALPAIAWALARCLDERSGPPVCAACIELGPGDGAILVVAGRAGRFDAVECEALAGEVARRARRQALLPVPVPVADAEPPAAAWPPAESRANGPPLKEAPC